ncbi:uncharacterized protein LOC131068323 isoform X5 [Cryptomeria japonica]|uniref:uncharacterized protein LOC131068323 isoform X5 n=1 Tax=Cryptomeria japonica TaxID=3369 RepID=UPI0027DA3C9E|nr:uncharacterized protein LOC131068323 isoform X5 [Cryptomeria japonica]
MASRLAVDQQVLDGVILLLILKEGFEWLEKKLSYLCGYLQAANQLRAQDLYVEEWQQEVRDIVEHKADEFIRLCCPRGKGRTGKNIPSNHTGMRLEQLTRLEKICGSKKVVKAGKTGNNVKANNAKSEIYF